MPIIYIFPGDELPVAVTPLNVDEDSNSWWAGTQLSFASIALAATLSLTSLSTEIASNQLNTLWEKDDVPAGNLLGQPEELFWQNPVAPVPATLLLLQQWPFEQNDPAGSLFGIPEEMYWQNPVAPVVASLYQRLPYLPDLNDDPAGNLKGLPDELFWQNPTPPIPATLRLQQQWEFDEQIPAGSLFNFSPDEDYWQNPASLQMAILTLLLQPFLLDDGNMPFTPTPPPGGIEMNLHIGYQDAMTVVGTQPVIGGSGWLG